MNDNSGLAMIVGGFVVVAAAFIFFGTDMFSRGDGGADINVRIEEPAASSAN